MNNRSYIVIELSDTNLVLFSQVDQAKRTVNEKKFSKYSRVIKL